MVKNIVFKTPGSWIWLSGGLTHLCWYFQSWLPVYLNYLEGDEELFVHVRFPKRTFELATSHWGQMSFIFELEFWLACKVRAIMDMYYSSHAIPFRTANDSKTTCTVYYSLDRDCLFMIAGIGFCSLDHLSE